MNPTDQIAAEAAEEIWHLRDTRGAKERLTAIIKAAIEKSTEELVEQIDLNRDEFLRIKACPDCTDEIKELCERSRHRIKQNVPLIKQRDMAINVAIAEKAKRLELESRAAHAREDWPKNPAPLNEIIASTLTEVAFSDKPAHASEWGALKEAHHVLGCLVRSLDAGALIMNPSTLIPLLKPAYKNCEVALSQHASEQGQEKWTHEAVIEIWEKGKGLTGGFKAIAEAHNATLQPQGELIIDEETELVSRIANYLSSGGLFNPEMMEHPKVRDLIIDCRDAIEKFNARRDSGEDTKLLGELLAMIHGDGGHYQSDHGTEKAVKDAVRIVCDLRVRIDAQGEDTKRLDWLIRNGYVTLSTQGDLIKSRHDIDAAMKSQT